MELGRLKEGAEEQAWSYRMMRETEGSFSQRPDICKIVIVQS
jgi:hypothetical protein